jgi:predicted metal-dependent HD superfamily phosphohydrolase
VRFFKQPAGLEESELVELEKLDLDAVFQDTAKENEARKAAWSKRDRKLAAVPSATTQGKRPLRLEVCSFPGILPALLTCVLCFLPL